MNRQLFRFRGWIFSALITLGFWAPWERTGNAHPGTVWLMFAGALTRMGWLPIAYASIAVMAMAILLAVMGAGLRTWAAAYLGTGVVQDRALHGERVVADGPYRYVRNPLYLGLWLHLLALAVAMPPQGALWMLAGSTLLIAGLIRAEEQHLTATQGEAYLAYARRVPRFVWSWRARVPAGTERPHWLNGVTGELYMWGVAITYILFASRYDAQLLVRGVLVSAGIAVVARGLRRPMAAPAHQ